MAKVKWTKSSDFKVGDKLIGTYLATEEGSYGPRYRFDTVHGTVILDNCKCLNEFFAKIPPNTDVEMTYHGRRKDKRGNLFEHRWTIIELRKNGSIQHTFSP